VFAKRTKLILVTACLVGVALIGLIAYRFFVLHLVRVPTGAMANTIIPGDHLVVKKRFFGEIKRGDIIVFKYPGDTATSYIARVIGMPGESIQLQDTRVFVDGSELPEERVFVKRDLNQGLLEELSSQGRGPYRVFYFPRDEAAALTADTPFATTDPFAIPAEHYFVMGDNRDNSEDSRFRGPVAGDEIFGKARMIYFSIGSQRLEVEEQIRWNRMFKKLN
jgi:signal peptidase I